jgi:hypothetical protein
MKLKDLKNHNWKEDDKIFVVTTKFKDNVVIPDTIEEKHFLDNPGYYTYIYDEVFLTMEDAKKGFVEKSISTRRTIKRKMMAEIKKLEEIEKTINILKTLNTEVKSRAVEYGA